MKVLFTRNVFVEDTFYPRSDFPQDFTGDASLLPKSVKILDKPMAPPKQEAPQVLRDLDAIRQASDAEQKIHAKVTKEQTK